VHLHRIEPGLRGLEGDAQDLLAVGRVRRRAEKENEEKAVLHAAQSIIGSMGLLSGRKILVTGLLSNRSIAYGIAKAARREGAELALTYQNERFKDRVAGWRVNSAPRSRCRAK